MGKSSRRRATASTSAASGATEVDVADVPVVGQREPCPCGSGKRYKQCHGRARAAVADAFVHRPFAGLAGEADWVALREVVPAATATARLAPSAVVPASGDQPAIESFTVATVLPLAWPALRRADGHVLVGMQTGGGSGDVSRDVGTALAAALAAEPGTPITLADVAAAAGTGPRLQDLLDTSAPLTVSVHEGFDFWVEGQDELEPAVRASLESANAAVIPTVRLTGVEGAYWCRIGDKTHLRWVLTDDEEPLLDAIARLHAAGESGLGEGTRYIGAFRAHGLVVPVWDLVPDAEAADVEDAAAAFGARLTAALAVSAPLTYDERRARAGVVSRQLTLR
jgi:hypothetical protein